VKTDLFEMVVRSQRVANAPPAYNDERKAIGRAPILIMPSGEEEYGFGV
jgi:hypothetical protein